MCRILYVSTPGIIVSWSRLADDDLKVCLDSPALVPAVLSHLRGWLLLRLPLDPVDLPRSHSAARARLETEPRAGTEAAAGTGLLHAHTISPRLQRGLATVRGSK